ncbi:hypothetical protein FRC12_017023 [Ceratobasidium sp. 428]|nr:hypothetical protein FRC12_017023 [Ceratobasidium sp. 428]
MAPPRKSRYSATDSLPGPSINRKRKSESITEPVFSAPSLETTESSTTFESPTRPGSGRYSKASSNYTHADSRTSLRTKFHPTTPSFNVDDGSTSIATSQAPEKKEIEEMLRAELEGAIFHDPNFVKNYLTVNQARLDTVLNRCENALENYTFPSIRAEPDLYQPIAWILNQIKQAVDDNAGQNRSVSAFLPVDSEPIPAHWEDTTGNKPDIVLFDGETRHWETVRMSMEVKKDASRFNEGLIQLARYARAVFGNQLHRRHVYGMLICEWEATFVRFDRSGILYSTKIDMRRQRKEFREAFAGLMLLDEEAFGYDIAFTTRPKSDGSLEYYIDLPAGAFPSEPESDATAGASTATPGPSTGTGTPSKSPTRRLKVMRILCHRKTIRGRATIALRVREVIRVEVSEELKETKGGIKTRSQKRSEGRPVKQEIEVLGARDYVLKLMWRDPNKAMEGAVLKRLVGIYGVGQYVWHSDVFKRCDSPGCGRSMDNSCGKCLDRTPDEDGAWVGQDPTTEGDVSNETRKVEATNQTTAQPGDCSPVYAHRTSRIFCRLLMSTVGSPLCTAGSSRELLQAVLDATLGYWRLVNMGLLHRDISDGNVLMLKEKQGYSKREWELPRTVTNEDSVLARSERVLQEVLTGLGRDPTGMLNDFDLCKTYDLMGVSFFGDSDDEEDFDLDERGPKRRKLNKNVNASNSDKGKGRETTSPGESSFSRVAGTNKGAPRIDFRTGTPTFMSARILEMEVGQQYEHHFVDDLESFFWLILWCVVEHRDARGDKATPAAYELLDGLSQHKLSGIADKKGNLLRHCEKKGTKMRSKLAACGNRWAADPAVVTVILRLGSYFQDIYGEDSLSECMPDDVFPKFVGIITDALKLPEPTPDP